MKNTSSLLAENEYILLISSANNTSEKILETKKELQKKYNLSSPAFSSDIFLAKFNNLHAREELMIHSINESIYGVPPLFISMKNILEIPKHSFVVPVTSKVALSNLVKSLKQITRVIRTAEVKPFFTSTFQVPLFSRLLPYQFEQMLPECSQYAFNAQYIATELKLLKRDQSHHKKWETVSTFQLKKEKSVIQSQLF